MRREDLYDGHFNEPPLPRATIVAWALALLLALFVVWAWFFELDEVTTGSGTVVPSSREQIIQSLEGGILTRLSVKEGDIVERGQVLAQLDRTKTESGVQESISRYNAALARAARLNAEVNDTLLTFPEELQHYSSLIAQETRLYESRRSSLTEGIKGLREGIVLVDRELAMTQPLVRKGAASDVEVLRLQRQKNDLNSRITEMNTQLRLSDPSFVDVPILSIVWNLLRRSLVL